MSTDNLPERLRELREGDYDLFATIHEAADEIERLRAKVAQLETDVLCEKSWGDRS